MPVLQRALKQRDTETKMHAAQIIGNMSSLTNQKDLEPYLPQILPGLKQVWRQHSFLLLFIFRLLFFVPFFFCGAGIKGGFLS